MATTTIKSVSRQESSLPDAASNASLKSTPNPGQVVPAAPKGPPLWKIHEFPAPIRAFPLPNFYPNNPISLAQIAFAWVRQLVSPPREPSLIFEGTWSSKTRSVIVTDPKSIRALWERGFYGKGHLSRSEPNWLKREQTRKGAAHGNHVAELHTAQRREERVQMKWQRARKAQETIQRTRYEEARVAPVGPVELVALPNSQRDLDLLIYGISPSNGEDDSLHELPPPTLNGSASDGPDEQMSSFSLNGQPDTPRTLVAKAELTESPEELRSPTLKRRKSVRFSPDVRSTTFQNSDPPSPNQSMVANGNGKIPDGILTNGFASLSRDGSLTSIEETLFSGDEDQQLSAGEIPDKEHLQLTIEEAFWLNFGLGVLHVTDESTDAMIPTETLFTLCRQNSYFPPRMALEPDDPFLIHYSVYHHFRSLGWVTRPGIKFGCDWLLYHRGPAFNHAEFAIIVLPAYSDPYWKQSGREMPHKTWHWLHMVNRVQSTAMKSLVLVYVEIPPPAVADLDIPSTLKRYKIKEFMIKRWLINRNRD